jgi:hypothetical protein
VEWRNHCFVWGEIIVLVQVVIGICQKKVRSLTVNGQQNNQRINMSHFSVNIGTCCGNLFGRAQRVMHVIFWIVYNVRQVILFCGSLIYKKSLNLMVKLTNFY